ncbi:MAG: hypothetical protein HZA52_04130 [Planctomycetes bacterium]|nr:hypothetical protein [Planctomycetota bacterium]
MIQLPQVSEDPAHDGSLGEQSDESAAAAAVRAAQHARIAAGAITGAGSYEPWWYGLGHHKYMLGGHSRVGLRRSEQHWTQRSGRRRCSGVGTALHRPNAAATRRTRGTHVAGASGVKLAVVSLVLLAVAVWMLGAAVDFDGNAAESSARDAAPSRAGCELASIASDDAASPSRNAVIPPSASERQGWSASERVADAEDEPRGLCRVHVVVPAEAAACGTVALFESPPERLLRFGDARFLEDASTSQCFEWNPLVAPEGRTPELTRVDDRRGEFTLEFEDAPLRTALWLVACDARSGQSSIPPGFAPIVVELTPIERTDTPIDAYIEFVPLGGVRGRLARAGELSDIDWEDDRDSCDKFRLEPDARDRSSGLRSQHQEREFSLWPLSDGMHEIEVVTAGEGHAHRFVLKAAAAAGVMTDVGEVRLDATSVALEVDMRTRSDGWIRGDYELELEGWPTRVLCAGLYGGLVLHGDWSGLTRLRFVPRGEGEFEPVVVDIDLSRGPKKLELVVSERRPPGVQLVVCAIAPDRTRVSECAFAFATHDGSVWQRVTLGTMYGSFFDASESFDPGRHELIAWMPKSELSYVGPLDVPSRSGSRLERIEFLELPFKRTNTCVRGQVRGTYCGEEVNWAVDLGVRLVGTGECWRWPIDARGLAGRTGANSFELRGLPAGVALELVVGDARGERCVIPLRLIREQLLELGELLVEHR